MSRSDSRKFWKYIKKFKGGNKNQANINVNDFLNHFKQMSATPNENCFSNCNYSDSADGINIDSLDDAFTTDEIIKTISSMSRNKSADLDGNVADIFIEYKEFIVQFLVKYI